MNLLSTGSQSNNIRVSWNTEFKQKGANSSSMGPDSLLPHPVCLILPAGTGSVLHQIILESDRIIIIEYTHLKEWD